MIPEWRGPEAVDGGAGSAFHRFAATDIDVVRDTMCGRFRPHAINPRGDLTLTKFRYNREMTIEAPPLDDFFVMKFALSGRCETSQGNVSTSSLPALCASSTPPGRSAWKWITPTAR